MSADASDMTRAVTIDAFGAADVLRLRELPLAGLEAGQVLLRGLAAGVNPIDIGTRAGLVIPRERARFPMVLGWDVAGEIVRVGASVADWRVGDRAIAMVRQIAAPMGTHAEHVVIDASLLARWPESVPAPLAGALPLAGLTARSALDVLALAPGQVLLINGVLGAVGSIVC